MAILTVIRPDRQQLAANTVNVSVIIAKCYHHNFGAVKTIHQQQQPPMICLPIIRQLQLTHI